MSKKHHKSGLRRTQVYMTQESRDVLDLDCEILALNESGRAVRNLTDRIHQILVTYKLVVDRNVPELHPVEWAELIDQTTDSAGLLDDLVMRFENFIPADSKLSNPEARICWAVAVADVITRFRSFDPALSFAERLSAAGGKVPNDNPPT